MVRFFKHLLWPRFRLQLRLAKDIERIERAVYNAESGHGGEIRLCIEGNLTLRALTRGMTPRDRAVEVFSAERVWDTRHNTGILVYILMADAALEIVCDEGVTIPPEILTKWVDDFIGKARGDFTSALCKLLDAIGTYCRSVLGADRVEEDELPNAPKLL